MRLAIVALIGLIGTATASAGCFGRCCGMRLRICPRPVFVQPVQVATPAVQVQVAPAPAPVVEGQLMRKVYPTPVRDFFRGRYLFVPTQPSCTNCKPTQPLPEPKPEPIGPSVTE